jgi:hypothetical protein
LGHRGDWRHFIEEIGDISSISICKTRGTRRRRKEEKQKRESGEGTGKSFGGDCILLTLCFSTGF